MNVTVPEPATEYILTQSGTSSAEQALVKPVPFTINATQITEANYAVYAKLYDVTGLEPPPPPVKTVSKGLDAAVAQDPHESTKSMELPIDDGYKAKYALFQCDWFGWDHRVWVLQIGSNSVDGLGSVGYFDMASEIGSVPVAYIAYQVELLSATIELFCERTDRAIAIWQLKNFMAQSPRGIKPSSRHTIKRWRRRAQQRAYKSAAATPRSISGW